MVAINRFGSDTDAELALLRQICEARGADFALSEVFARGGKGGMELAKKIVAACEKPSNFQLLYPDEASIKEKIETVARKIYGAAKVKYLPAAEKAIAEFEALDPAYARFPVCMAKTQYSLSDDAAKLGRPTGYTLTVREVKLSAGAGFIVVLTGSILTMPGLPKSPPPSALMWTTPGNISGLF